MQIGALGDIHGAFDAVANGVYAPDDDTLPPTPAPGGPAPEIR